MASLITNVLFELSVLYPNLIFILVGISETAGFDKDGNPTGKTVGYTLNLVEKKRFRHLKVKIPKIQLPITAEEVKQKCDLEEQIYIQLQGAKIKQYFSTRTDTIEDSISADSFEVIEIK